MKASPQTILDELVGRLTFDPLEFSRMKAKDQAETIRSVAGLDFASLEQAKTEAYEKRTEVNREAKALKARIVYGVPEGPSEAVDTAALVEKLKEGRLHNDRIAQLQSDRRSHDAAVGRWEREVERLDEEISRLQSAKSQATVAKLESEGARKRVDDVLLTLTHVGLEAIEQAIMSAELTNAAVKARAERAELEKAFRGKERMSDLLSQTLADLEEERLRAIAGAALPVPGLGFTEEGDLTMNGVPFEQASQAEQLRVSIAVGMAANPKLRVLLIRDGSLLDNDSMKLVAEMAAENDCQLWVERIENDEHTSVVIEDGEVV